MSYSYGSFVINNNSGGLGYFLLSKDLDLPTYKPTLHPLARYDGFKVAGWQLDSRQIQCDIIVVGSSRTDCESRLDTLFQALALRDQNLNLHASDTRYWVANATTGKVKFAAGQGIVHARVPVTFICASPFAQAASTATPYDTGSLSYSLNGSLYTSSTFTFAAGGTAYTWPQIHLIHKTPVQGSTTLTSALTQGTSYSSSNPLPVASSPSLIAGQVITLYYNTGSPLFQLWTQKFTVASNVSSGATTLPVQAATANYNFPSGTSVYISTAWNSVTVSQTTDNYVLTVNSTSAVPLPQSFNDYLDIYTDPTTGMYVATNGLPQYSDPIGAFPPLEPGNTSWTVAIGADYAVTCDASWTWTVRWLN